MYLSKQKLHMDTRKRISSLSGCSAVWKTDKDLEGSWCTEGKAKCKDEEESSGQTVMGVLCWERRAEDKLGKAQGRGGEPAKDPPISFYGSRFLSRKSRARCHRDEGCQEKASVESDLDTRFYPTRASQLTKSWHRLAATFRGEKGDLVQEDDWRVWSGAGTRVTHTFHGTGSQPVQQVRAEEAAKWNTARRFFLPKVFQVVRWA